MLTENCSSLKLSTDLNASTAPNNTSVLEDDLALSSSTLGTQDKSLHDYSEVRSRLYNPQGAVVYVNEETMDCSYSESVETPKTRTAGDEASSPEMFESDDDENGRRDFREILPRRHDKSSFKNLSSIKKCEKPSAEELIAQSDSHLLARMNKFLTGVPPPPKHTICQSDCADFLACIRANREYFLVDPLSSPNEKTATIVDEAVKTTGNTIEMSENISENSTNGRSFNNHRGKNSLRNLTNAFDACDRSSDTTTSIENESTRERFPDNSINCCTSPELTSNENVLGNNTTNHEINSKMGLGESSTSNIMTTEIPIEKDKAKHVTFQMPEKEAARFYNTIEIEEVKNIPWEIAYRHKTHGIHYNRSKTVEEFEGLTLKLCQRYIGAETQSSCNIWFTKQTPSSVKKRNLLSRRNNGQSPGKRLSHLARRRRTFSSANLQGLGMVDKKQLVLNIKKPTIRKGKSPRGKSPRGSAKKRAALSRISPSPRKCKLETSKRALFQSPPGDRAGPSNRQTTCLANTNSQHKIKRALFQNTKIIDDVAATGGTNVNDIKKVLSFEETKKRKSEDELEGPRFKWAKSLSFDCPRVTESNSSDSWTAERHSTGNFHMKSQAPIQQGKIKLSEANRKKLLWAVAEALRAKGISLGHPRFKQCASQLVQTVKKYMPDLENPNVPRKPGSTTERMLRLAKRHVLLIVESKSTE